MRKLFPLLKLLAWQWRSLLLGLMLSFLCIISSIGLLVLAGWLITATAIAGLAGVVFFNYFVPAAGIRAFALLRIITRYGERVINHNATFKILRDLRSWCYRQLEPLAPAHFQHYQSGDLLQRLVSDIDDLDHLYLRVLSPLIISFLLTIPIFVFAYFFSTPLAWLLLSAFLISTLLAIVMGLWLGKIHGAVTLKQLTRLRIQLINNLQAPMEIIVFGLCSSCQKAFDTTQQQLANAQLTLSSRQGLGTAVMMLLTGLTLISVLTLGIPLVQHHNMPVAILAMLVFLVIAAFEVILPLPTALQSLGKTQAAAERINELVTIKPTVIFPTQTTLSTNNFDLCLDKVSFQYPRQNHCILSNINLDIPAGKKIAIIGPSGAGKSTLVHLLTRSWDPTVGKILLGEHCLTEYTENVLRNTISIAQQQTHIFNQPIRNNLLIANPNANDDELWKILAAVQLETTIRNCREGLNTEMGEFGHRFSGGQVKRMGIARALLSPANIIILDEPSEGVDDMTYQQVWNGIQPFLVNRTLIIITHNEQNLDRLDNVYQLQPNSGS